MNFRSHKFKITVLVITAILAVCLIAINNKLFSSTTINNCASELSTPGETYILGSNIVGSCIVAANNIVIDGQDLYSISGNVSATTTPGIAGKNFIIQNVTNIGGNVTSVGYNEYVPPGYSPDEYIAAKNGGNVTIIDSTVDGNVSTNGGDGTLSADGNGGNVVITDSEVGGVITAYGGPGAVNSGDEGSLTLTDNNPTLTLLGSDPMTVSYATSYNEPGATAVDEKDGVITGDIDISGTVDVNNGGTYVVTYTITDSGTTVTFNGATNTDGPNTVTDTRTVVVERNGGGGGGGGDEPPSTTTPPIIIIPEIVVPKIIPPEPKPEIIVPPQEPQQIKEEPSEPPAQAPKISEPTPDTLSVIYDTYESTVKDPVVQEVGKTVATLGVIFGGAAPIIPIVTLQFKIADIALNVNRFFSSSLSFFGLAKRRKPWGTVFDSMTKKPIRPAKVSLVNAQGELTNNFITYSDGRYGFSVGPGAYYMRIEKPGYTFPSKVLFGKAEDDFYESLYFGEPINVYKRGELVIKNIPVDPIDFDFNKFELEKSKKLILLSNIDRAATALAPWFLGIGLIFVLSSFFYTTEIFDGMVIVLYSALFVLQFFGIGMKSHGRVIGKNGDPIAYGLMRIYNPTTGELVSKTVLDHLGRYYSLIPSGAYKITVDLPVDQGRYERVLESVVGVRNGILNKVFKIG